MQPKPPKPGFGTWNQNQGLVGGAETFFAQSLFLFFQMRYWPETIGGYNGASTVYFLPTRGSYFLKAPLIWYQLYIVLSSYRKKKYSREPNMIDMRSGNSNHVP